MTPFLVAPYARLKSTLLGFADAKVEVFNDSCKAFAKKLSILY